MAFQMVQSFLQGLRSRDHNWIYPWCSY